MKTAEEIKRYIDSKYSPTWIDAKNKPLFQFDTACAKECYIYLDSSQRSNQEYRWHFYDIDQALNGIFLQLWNNEEIVNVEIFNDVKDMQSLYSPQSVMILLTSSNRMFICRQVTYPAIGYGCVYSDLNNIDVNKCRILEVENRTLFGKIKPSTYGQLILNDSRTFQCILLTVLPKLYDAIIKHINEYKVEKAIRVTTVEDPNAKSSSSISEIRKLYEDGIISKEEMLDLIKSVVNK